MSTASDKCPLCGRPLKLVVVKGQIVVSCLSLASTPETKR